MASELIKKEYKGIDVFKFICAVMVVAIHTFKAEENSVGFYFTLMHFCSLAVPFFFVCSGFFLFKKMEFDEKFRIKKTKENFAILVTFEKRIILSYLIWSVIYFIVKLANAFSDGKQEVVEYIKELPFNFFLNGTELHLWYLLCIIYAVPILYFILRRAGIKLMVAAA
ncbi:MAG: acyltransferase, partial [Clostridia bacterium]|nr:acyltransferase [Clostridia bacterium]